MHDIISVEFSNPEEDYWQIKLGMFQCTYDSFRSIEKIIKTVQAYDYLFLFRRPSPFSFLDSQENYYALIANTDKIIRPEEVIGKISKAEQEDRYEEKPSRDFIIKGQFQFSWDEIEYFYRFSFIDKYCEWKIPALRFIKELRKLGYDNIFRAGQQLSTFILSRCLNHGMQPRTNHLRLTFLNKAQVEVTKMSNGMQVQKDIFRLGINEELINILEKMKDENDIT